MTNPKLEKHILGIAASLLAVGIVILFVWNIGRTYSIIGLTVGYVLSAFNLLGLSCLFGNLNKTGNPLITVIKALLPGLSIVATIAVLFFSNRFSLVLFWCCVAGVFLVPVAVVMFVIAEATGLIHTDFYV